MPKIEGSPHEYVAETLHALAHEGLLLASVAPNGKPNAMTIGWGQIGIMWRLPVFVVPVRFSRYTFECIEHTGDFTVNVLPADLVAVAEFCGTVSGRDRDKFAERGLRAVPGQRVKSALIEQCVIHYECHVRGFTNVEGANLSADVGADCYPEGNFHRLYHGEILRVCADPDARQRVSLAQGT
jgi:flavin reductase (DIM6/NTAB) family NADH-FMN oxidoreductase RutF